MNLYDRISNSITKLQNLPEKQKRYIFFTVIGISALIMTFFLIVSAKSHILGVVESAKSINVPDFNMDQSNGGVKDVDTNSLDVVSEEDSLEIIEK